MVSKSTTQIGFRFPLKHVGLLDDEVKRGRFRSRASYCRDILVWACDTLGDGYSPVKKFLFYDKVKKDRERLDGPSLVIAVRLPLRHAFNIRELAQRGGNNVSEFCGNVILAQL